MKKWIAALLTAAMLAGSVPADMLAVKAEGAKSEGAAVTIEDTAYGILDNSVKGKKITPGSGFSIQSHKLSSGYGDFYGAGYTIVRENATGTYYLIGTKGIVKSFYTGNDTAPKLELLFNCSLDTPYEIYKVKNPETGKYDIYNANTNTYHEYGLDDCYTAVSSRTILAGEYGCNLIFAKRDGKLGLIDERGIMIYGTIYSSINPYSNCLIGWVKDSTGSSCAILTEDGSTDGERLYDTIDKGVYKDYVLAVKNQGKYALLFKDTLKLMTDFMYSSVSFMTYENRYYMVCSYWEEVTDKYNVTEESTKCEVYTTDGTSWNVNGEFGGIKGDARIKGDCLAVSVTDTHTFTGTGNVTGEQFKEPVTKRYLMTPDKDIKYLCDCEGTCTRINNCQARYGKFEQVLDTKVYKNFIYDENYQPLYELSGSLVRVGKYLVLQEKNKSSNFSYVICDTLTGEILYDDVYIRSEVREDSPVICFAKSETADKFGIFDVETGKFSGYVFDGNEPSYVDSIVNGNDKTYIVYEDKYHYINQDFKVISTANDLREAGALAKSGENLLKYNGIDGNYYSMSVLKYEGTEIRSFLTEERYMDNIAQYGEYDKDYEAYQTVDKDSGEKGLVVNDGRIATDNISRAVGTTNNGLTFVKQDSSMFAVIDNNGNALLYGDYDVDDYNDSLSSVNRGNFISFVKDGSVYLYDFSDCHGYIDTTDSSVVTEDDLFAEYNRFLNNGFYNSMCEDVEVQMAETLSHYGHSAQVVAFAKSALDGKSKYVLGKLVNMVSDTNLNETRAHQEMALEYIKSLETEIGGEYFQTLSNTNEIVDKVNKTFQEVFDLSYSAQKDKFVKIWAGNNANKQDEIYKFLGFVEKNQKKIDDYCKATGAVFTTLEYCTVYLSIHMLQEGLVEDLMELVPADSELYNGLRAIRSKQKGIGIADLAAKVFDEEMFKLVSDAAEEGVLKVIGVKNPTVVGIIIELCCKIAAASIDSPDLEAVDKTILALANALTLKESVTDYQSYIKSNYENAGGVDVSTLKGEYKLLCSTYYKSLFTGLKYAKAIAADDEISQIERYQTDYEKKLIYRSYIGTCLVNARANWEYTVHANKVVISKLKTSYPTGAGRVPLAELYDSWFNEKEEMAKSVYSTVYMIDIPTHIDGMEVKSLDADAFYGEQNIGGVYIPDEVESVDNKTFQECDGILLFVGNSDNAETKYEDVENVTAQVREKKVTNLEIVTKPEKVTMGIQDDIDTTGLKLRVTYADGITKEVESDFYCDIVERKVGENLVVVCYGGCEATYPVEITSSECSYTISYQDEFGNELAEKVTGTAMTGTVLNIPIPEIEGYTPVNTEQTETIGYKNDFVVIYKEKEKISIESAVVEIEEQKFAHAELTPDVKVTLDGKELVKDVDYSVSYSDNYYPGQATVVITGQGDYKDTLESYFNIIEEEHEWDNGVVTKKATCTASGTITYTCKNCRETKKSTIFKASNVKLETAAYVYNGKKRSPSVVVKDSKGNKIDSSNYTISKPAGRKNVGKYTYKITFKNQYSGTKNLTLTINPKGTTVAGLTKASKAFTVKWKKQSAKMAASRITGYDIQYSTSKKFTSPKIKSVSGYGTTSKKITGLKAKKTYYVRVRTYKTIKVNGKNVKLYSGWSAAKSVKTK